MKRVICRVALLLAASLLLPLAAHAQAFRTYLASYGNDANPCSVGSPCRLLPAALNNVLSGGEIWILDSANYNSGTVNINKSVSILAVPGQTGSIVAVASTPAISITTPGIDVSLRNIVIANNANNPGTKGISMTAGNSLTVEDSVLANLPGAPVYVIGAGLRVTLKNTVIRNSGFIAIDAEEGAIVDVINCRLVGNLYGGVYATATVTGRTTLVNVSDTVISGQGTATGAEGIYAISNAGAAAHVYVTRSTIFNTQYALDSEGSGGSLVEVSASMVARNHWNVYQSGTGVIRSFGNNHISDGEVADQGTLNTAPLR